MVRRDKINFVDEHHLAYGSDHDGGASYER
jgi:hypothetical protein